MKRLENKVAIVTGGARGMGEATVRLFVEHGAKVVIADLLEEEGKALEDDLKGSAVFVKADVSDEADWKQLVATAETFGPLNVLVNNAAILHMASITDTTVEDYLRVIKINQLGCFLGIRSSIDAMKKAGGGSIINISSIDGLQSSPGLSAYSSAKWAVRGLTKNAAIELGQHNIRVNSVHPGGIYTTMGGSDFVSEEDFNKGFYAEFPLPRVGKAEEVANVSLFLATDEASYCTASEFIADGGWHAGMRRPGMPCS